MAFRSMWDAAPRTAPKLFSYLDRFSFHYANSLGSLFLHFGDGTTRIGTGYWVFRLQITVPSWDF